MNMENISNLKREVYEANVKLAGSGLVISTFGNVSGIDRKAGIVAIKPSGVSYQSMNVEDIVLVSLNGDKIEKDSLNPSSDTPTHLELYRNFKNIKGITHTHSDYASAFAQARMAIPCLGTTHADYFCGPVPVTGLIKDNSRRENLLWRLLKTWITTVLKHVWLHAMDLLPGEVAQMNL